MIKWSLEGDGAHETDYLILNQTLDPTFLPGDE